MRKQVKKFKEWEYSPEGIDYALDRARDLVPHYARIPLAKALSLLPKEIIDFAVNNCLFISIEPENKGEWFNIDHPYYKGIKGIILLGDIVWRVRPIERAFCIAHEVAHAFRGDDIIPPEVSKESKTSSVGEHMKMEIEADKLAIKWLVKHYKEKSLLKFCGYLKSKNKTTEGSESKRA